MEEVKLKKERAVILNRFIEKCGDAFGLTAKIKNIYDYKGRLIYDIADIPAESKFLYVSTNEIFVGISIINYSDKLHKIIEDRISKSLKSLENPPEDIEHNFSNELENDKKENVENFEYKKYTNKENIKKTINRSTPNNEYIYEKKYLMRKRNKSFDYGHFISKNYLEDEKENLKSNFADFLEEDQKNNNTTEFLRKKKERIKIYSLENKSINLSNIISKSSCDEKYKKEFYHRINYVISERYLSDDENNQQKAKEFIKINFPDSYKLFIYFLDFLTEKNKFFLENKISSTFKRLKKKEEKKKSDKEKLQEHENFINRPSLLIDPDKDVRFNYIKRENDQTYNKKENLEDDIINLIDKFNKNIDIKINSLENYIQKKKEKKNLLRPDCPDKITLRLKKEFVERTKSLLKNFIIGFQLFKSKSQKRGDYTIEPYKERKDLKYMYRNIEATKNVFCDLEKRVHRSFPSLFSLNIPKILEKYKNFSREELYELFVQYKVIMKISIAINKDRSIASKGIDFTSFYKGVRQIGNESCELAKKIFNVVNESKTNHLTLDEFLKGMSVIKSENISEKIDLFFRIIDTDGNGELSWNEVYNLCIMSLKRSLVVEDKIGEKFIIELAEYFSDLIFRLVDVNKDDEIPFPKIREVFILL